MGGGSALIVAVDHTEPCPSGYTGDGFTYYNHTWQEVKDAYDQGREVWLQHVEYDADVDGDVTYYRSPLGSLMVYPEGSAEDGRYVTWFSGKSLSAPSSIDFLREGYCEESGGGGIES